MILVTGGAGFIGSNIVGALRSRGKALVVCDRLRSGDKWRNLARHEVLDIVPPETLSKWLDEHGADLEAVVHMGAISSTTESDADLIFETNVRLSKSLWRFCADRGIPLIYASSAATYGDGSSGFDDDPSLEALARLRPLNAYGWSKHQFDRWVLRTVHDSGALPPQWVGLKFFNVYGPNEYHKGTMQSVIAQKYPLAASGRPVTLFRSHHPDYGDGEQRRDFVFVHDCVDVVCWLLEHPEVSGLFNLGTGVDRTFADLAGAVCSAVGVAPRIEYIDMPTAVQDRYQYFTRATMDRLRAAGYRRELTTLEEGVRVYVQDYLAREDPYR